jgi:hypothetical protein
MDKNTVIQNLHAMMDTRLFSGCPWLADREACDALRRKLVEMGLEEWVPGDEDSLRNTALGQELQLDLVMVFIGLWHEWEIPGILAEYGLIDETDEMGLCDQSAKPADPEKILGPIVRKAYRDHYQQSKSLA